jgi:hypothetical protein
MSKVYVGDTGTAIVLDVGVNISAASAQSIEAQRPDGSTVSWAGTIFETNKVRFVTQADSLNVAGDWKLQSRVVLPTGTWLGEVVKLTVHRPFD